MYIDFPQLELASGPQIKELSAVQFNYITAIRKAEIRALLATGRIQPPFFDEPLNSVM